MTELVRYLDDHLQVSDRHWPILSECMLRGEPDHDYIELAVISDACARGGRTFPMAMGRN